MLLSPREYNLFQTSTPRKCQTSTKPKAEVGKLVRVCPGGTHGWYESNVGLIRKQIQ